MPVSCLKIKDSRLIVISSSEPANKTEFVTVVQTYLGDENFQPVGEPAISVHEISEEQYHKRLRKDASKKGHFVKEYSTDPDWNPVL